MFLFQQTVKKAGNIEFPNMSHGILFQCHPVGMIHWSISNLQLHICMHFLSSLHETE
jgi:hypothetical protein